MANKKAEAWAKKNLWFGKDDKMTNAAFKIHEDLVNKEKIDANTDKYYDELDKRIKKLFPPTINKKEALLLVSEGEFSKIPVEFWNDKYFVLEAVKKFGAALSLADKSLTKDKSIVLEAVKQNGAALQYADINLKKDKSIVLVAVKQFGSAIQYAHKSLKKDSDIIKAAEYDELKI
jgi:hypothetical protein